MTTYQVWLREETKRRLRLVRVGLIALLSVIALAAWSASARGQDGGVPAVGEHSLARTVCREPEHVREVVGYIIRDDREGFRSYLLADGNSCAQLPRYVPIVIEAIEGVEQGDKYVVTIFRVRAIESGLQAYVWHVREQDRGI